MSLDMPTRPEPLDLAALRAKTEGTSESWPTADYWIDFGSDSHSDARFIAALDPPTVIALLDLAERAQAADEPMAADERPMIAESSLSNSESAGVSGKSVEYDEGLVALLAEHQYVPSGLRGVSRCACGVAFHGMPHDHRAHVAAVIRDAGYVHIWAHTDAKGGKP